MQAFLHNQSDAGLASNKRPQLGKLAAGDRLAACRSGAFRLADMLLSMYQNRSIRERYAGNIAQPIKCGTYFLQAGFIIANWLQMVGPPQAEAVHSDWPI